MGCIVPWGCGIIEPIAISSLWTKYHMGLITFNMNPVQQAGPKVQGFYAVPCTSPMLDFFLLFPFFFFWPSPCPSGTSEFKLGSGAVLTNLGDLRVLVLWMPTTFY